MRRLLSCALALALAGCGSTTRVRERDLVVPGRSVAAPALPAAGPQARRGGALRIAVVTHGQASSAFWAIVRNGVESAGRQMDVLVTYRSPDVYSVPRMRRLIDQAVATRPDALVVSIPSDQLGGAIRRAVAARIPVVSINSGADLFRRFGVLAHVGQEETSAGAAAGRRLAAAGVRRGLCVDHELGNEGLEQRCRAFARAMRAAGGTAREVVIDPNDPRAAARVAAALRDNRIDGVLSLGSGGAVVALDAARRARRPEKIGTFDLSPDVLAALRAGRLLFAVDQQAYLQGYLPIVLLTQRLRYGLFPAQGEVIPTGPSFVTRETAAKAIRLSRRSIR